MQASLRATTLVTLLALSTTVPASAGTIGAYKYACSAPGDIKLEGFIHQNFTNGSLYNADVKINGHPAIRLKNPVMYIAPAPTNSTIIKGLSDGFNQVIWRFESNPCKIIMTAFNPPPGGGYADKVCDCTYVGNPAKK